MGGFRAGNPSPYGAGSGGLPAAPDAAAAALADAALERVAVRRIHWPAGPAAGEAARVARVRHHQRLGVLSLSRAIRAAAAGGPATAAGGAAQAPSLERGLLLRRGGLQ